MMLLALLFCIGLVPSTEAFVQCVCCMTSSFDSPLNVRDAPSTGGNIIGEVGNKYICLVLWGPVKDQVTKPVFKYVSTTGRLTFEPRFDPVTNTRHSGLAFWLLSSLPCHVLLLLHLPLSTRLLCLMPLFHQRTNPRFVLGPLILESL